MRRCDAIAAVPFASELHSWQICYKGVPYCGGTPLTVSTGFRIALLPDQEGQGSQHRCASSLQYSPLPLVHSV